MDGGVDYHTIAWACLAGIGIWWPNPSDAVGSFAQYADGDGNRGPTDARLRSCLLHAKETDYGVQQWHMLPGQMCSSTRAEIAAVAGALTDD